MRTESCLPNPEYLIKSIAEQGYTLETSIADLIDNSITAGARRVEVLVDTKKPPYSLFIADDGNGMSQDELKKNMEFPSISPEAVRALNDLGRFGLGMKTASFAQTRCFTVIAREKGGAVYSSRTWNVDHLAKGNWEVIINEEEETRLLLEQYKHLSKGFLNPFNEFQPNTIIVWQGLYKYERDAERPPDAGILQHKLTERTREYLQLIFHRFMEGDNPLCIRLNNSHLIPFNPFPSKARQIPARQKTLLGNKLRLEGYVLPNSSIAESKGNSEWTLTDKSLIDMEGLYVYRADRIIVFGGWFDLVRKTAKLQLARLKVEIDNGIDHLFELNVAKSSISIPQTEQMAVKRYIVGLITEAKKEMYNYEKQSKSIEPPGRMLLKRVPTSQGIILKADDDFPLLNAFKESLNETQRKQLKIILRMMTTKMNQIRQVHADDTYATLHEKEGIAENDLVEMIHIFLKNGVNKKVILNDVIPAMGIEAGSLPASVLSFLT